MHLGAPDTWRLIWVVAAGFFLVAEMVRRLRLWFLPFAVGAYTKSVNKEEGLL